MWKLFGLLKAFMEKNACKKISKEVVGTYEVRVWAQSLTTQQLCYELCVCVCVCVCVQGVGGVPEHILGHQNPSHHIPHRVSPVTGTL